MHPDTKEAADRCHAAMRKIKLAEEIRMQDRAINIMQADFAGFKQIVDLTEADDEVLNVPKPLLLTISSQRMRMTSLHRQLNCSSTH